MLIFRWKVLFVAVALLVAFTTTAHVESSFAQTAGVNLPNPYMEVENWARLPEKKMGGIMYAPGVDSHGNVWILTRCGKMSNCVETNDPALLEFDSSGNFIKGIGQGLFAFPHGLFVDKDDNLWVADCGAKDGKGNQVTKLSPEGKVLLTLGKKGVMGGSPDNFIGPSSVLVAPDGDVFVTDGHAVSAMGGGGSYGFDPQTSDPSHMRVVKFSNDGKFIKAWGKLGTGPGEFNVPHGLAMDSQGRLFVADRGNNRIQIFDQDGKFLDQWKQFGKPVSVYIDRNDTLFAIDSDSNADMWDWKYSTIGGLPCPTCLKRIPRLTDVGLDDPDFAEGIRIGSAKDGIVRAFLPPHSGPSGPTGLPEFLVSDTKGNLFVGEARTMRLVKYAKKVELPEGPGKESVQRACTLCHDFEDFPRVNFDHEDWTATVNTMVAGGAPLSKEEVPAVVDYLANHFKGTETPGKQVPGPVQATITEWDLPTPNSMPYGIIRSNVNGFTWYTGEFANTIGRFDAKTQQFKQYEMRPGTNPTALLEFPGSNYMGVLYFSAQQGDFVGRFHPADGPYPDWKAGDVVEYKLPEPNQVFFHQIALGRYQSDMWFTVTKARPPFNSAGSKVGILRPWTTEIRLANTPTSDPYGIAVGSDGVPFYTLRDKPRIGSIDPDTMQATEYALPDSDSGVRGITITPDDAVWYTDYLRGYLGRFDSKTGKFSEWPSPSGPRSLPWGITDLGGVIWYAETGTKPNMLVRFDPKTEKFQSWPVKAGGGIRQIYADADGLWFTRPLTNGIAHVIVKNEPVSVATGR